MEPVDKCVVEVELLTQMGGTYVHPGFGSHSPHRNYKEDDGVVVWYVAVGTTHITCYTVTLSGVNHPSVESARRKRTFTPRIYNVFVV